MSGPGGSSNAPRNLPLPATTPLRPLPLHGNLASPGQMPPHVVRNTPNRALFLSEAAPANGLAGNLSSIAFENSVNLPAAALPLAEPANIRRNATHQALRAARAAVDNMPENIRRELESYIDRSRYGVPSPRSRSRSRNRNNRSRNNRNRNNRTRNRTARK